MPVIWDAVLGLVADNGLVLEGLAEHFATTLVARDSGRVVGTATLERYCEGVLLRSVAVARDVQRQGIGRLLTEAVIERARQLDAPAVFLLTLTAHRYFPQFGFERIERAAVPNSVRESVEFKGACPASAVVMRRSLRA